MIIPISNTFLNNIDKILYSFLWAGKPDRVSRKDICKTNLKGGLKMINLCHFEKSLKLSWLKLLTTNYSTDWFSVLQATVGDINKLYRVGIKWTRTLDSKLNPFWSTIFKYAENFSNKQNLKQTKTY